MNKSSKLEFQNRLENLITREYNRINELKDNKTIVSALPSSIYVEPTNACNFNCATCTPHEIKGKKGFLDINLWTRILKDFEKHKTHPTITLIGRGEPLLHPKIDEIVHIATSKKMPTYIISNGSMLKPELAKKLIDAGLTRIQISLHAFHKETHKKMTNRDAFDQVVENILNMVELNKKGQKCHITVMSVETEINRNEMKEFREFWQDKVDRVYISPAWDLHGDMKLPGESYKGTSAPVAKGEGCSIPWWFFAIRWDGKLVPCPTEHKSRIALSIENDQGEIDLFQAWNSETMQELRTAHLECNFALLKDKYDYGCHDCGALKHVDSTKNIKLYVQDFPTHFARYYTPYLLWNPETTENND